MGGRFESKTHPLKGKRFDLTHGTLHTGFNTYEDKIFCSKKPQSYIWMSNLWKTGQSTSTLYENQHSAKWKVATGYENMCV